jgi:hypothetical protein
LNLRSPTVRERGSNWQDDPDAYNNIWNKPIIAKAKPAILFPWTAPFRVFQALNPVFSAKIPALRGFASVKGMRPCARA